MYSYIYIYNDIFLALYLYTISILYLIYIHSISNLYMLYMYIYLCSHRNKKHKVPIRHIPHVKRINSNNSNNNVDLDFEPDHLFIGYVLG